MAKQNYGINLPPLVDRYIKMSERAEQANKSSYEEQKKQAAKEIELEVQTQEQADRFFEEFGRWPTGFSKKKEKSKEGQIKEASTGLYNALRTIPLHDENGNPLQIPKSQLNKIILYNEMQNRRAKEFYDRLVQLSGGQEEAKKIIEAEMKKLGITKTEPGANGQPDEQTSGAKEPAMTTSDIKKRASDFYQSLQKGRKKPVTINGKEYQITDRAIKTALGLSIGNRKAAIADIARQTGLTAEEISTWLSDSLGK